ncbi:hypothetical protein LTR28_010965 [Elasticomyces elasticus]|nr:hypothetical protein LTR28_010965 [Elasticomyces elasticus]
MITDPAQEAESKTVELKDDGLDAVTGMMQYFYGIDFETSKDNSFTTGERTHLAIKLYAISDKYGIPNLGTFAQAKFSKHLAQLFESDPSEDLIKVIDAVYATTPVEPCTRNALRYTIIQQMHHLLVFLAGAPVEVFKDLDIDGLPRDLVQSTSVLPLTADTPIGSTGTILTCFLKALLVPGAVGHTTLSSGLRADSETQEDPSSAVDVGVICKR